MKTARTILLCILALGLVFPVFAQETANKYNRIPANVKVLPGYYEAMKQLNSSPIGQSLKAEPINFGQNLNLKNLKPSSKKFGYNDQIQANPTGTALGTCWWDAQAGGNMPRHITTFADGSNYYFDIVALGSASGNSGKADFTSFGQTMPSYASMGSYYQFIDYTGNQPSLGSSWKRIEQLPTYTGSLFNYSEGKASVTSHIFPLQATTPLQISSNADVGDEAFVVGTIPNAITFFPRTIADGADNIHTLFSHRITGEANFNEMGYKKGSNRGATWADEVLMTGPNALGGAVPSAAERETYAIDAEGNNVVFAYVDRDLNFIYRKSTDNGATWGQATLLWAPEGSTMTTKKDAGGTFYGRTNDSIGPGMLMDAMIDSKGDCHFVVNIANSCHVGEVVKNSSSVWEFVAGTDSVVSGNKYYPMICFLYITIPADKAVQPTYAYVPTGDGGFNQQPNVYSPFQKGVRVDLNDSMSATFYAADPQLAYDPDGNIYLTYTSLRDSMNAAQQPDAKAILETNSGQSFTFYNRHIYATKFDKVAKQFTKPVNLTPNGWDCAFGSLPKKLVKKNGEVRLPIVYTADQEPTNWIDYHRGFNFTSEPKLYFNPFKLEEYTGSVGVNDEHTLSGSIDIVPNPVVNISNIYFSNPSSGSVSVDVFNMLGQKVQSLFNGFADAGTQSFTIDGNTLGNGTYICKITSNGTTTSQTIVIAR